MSRFGLQTGSLRIGSDVGLAVGVMALLAILVVPLPPFLLDFGLALSITASVLILMVGLFIVRPLDFTSFPTLLLMSTLLRLSLNVATTRLVLSHGNEGPMAAGHVVAAFGGFLMGGDVLIGLIVFSILLVVNFMVITKGSGRIAEVAARFSLDAMPGKQMAIDSDMSAGLVNDNRCQAAAARAGGGERVLRRHGWRGEIRPRRRDRRPHHHRHQHRGRPGDWRVAPWHGGRRRLRHLHHPDRRRWLGVTDPGALLVSTAAGIVVTKGGYRGHGRQGPGSSARRLPQSARRGCGHGPAAGDATWPAQCCRS